MSETKVDDKTSFVDEGAVGAPDVKQSKVPSDEEKIPDVGIKVKSSSVEGTEGSGLLPPVVLDKSLLEEVKVSNTRMSKILEPPAFVSDDKSYAEYKVDLQRWSRICGVEKKLQAEMVVYRLDGHPSRIKEKVNTQLGAKLEDNDDGLKELIAFFDGIYLKDTMADAWDKFCEFSYFVKRSEQSMSEFIAEWENCYFKMKNVQCEYSDLILAFKLLQASQLNEIDTKLVLTGVDYKEGKDKKNMLDQVKESLKKFKGRQVVTQEKRSVQISDTLVSSMEEVFLSKGWKPPKKERRRSRSVSPPRSNQPKSGNYKGRKNQLGADRLPMKCHKCRCDHTENCNCPCVYHFANRCPGVDSNKKSNVSKEKLQLGLFVDSNIFPQTESTYVVEEEELVLVMKESLEELILLTVEKTSVLIDCACPSTVTGVNWMTEFLNSLCEEDRRKVIIEESIKVYKFGGGEKRRSLAKVVFPCHFAGVNVKITTEVVEADFPLLVGNTLLKRANAILYFSEAKAVLMGNEVDMEETESGHFSLRIEQPKSESNYLQNNIYLNSLVTVESYINSTSEPLNLKDVQKLHHYFGHVPSRKLKELIQKSNRWTEDVKNHLEHVELHCRSCKMNQKAKPLPAVALPRASRFNQVVTLDLKEYSDGAHKYILYMVDMFSRLIAGSLIANKKPATVGAEIMKKWIAPMGRMEMLHSDRGGEFCCEELTQVAEYLSVRCTFTAASSPHQNGVNERNHAICDGMVTKMRMEDPSLSAEIALTWALAAKNSLENVSGFSPFQIVFGESPKLPSVYTTGPPGLEEVVMSKAVADHINALHLAREAYISGESDRIIKTALKQRIYKRGQEISQGDWIYFKNRGKWEGPVKVCTKDGKLLYAVRAGKLLTINSDHADIAMFEGEFLGENQQPTASEKNDETETANNTHFELLNNNEKQQNNKTTENCEQEEPSIQNNNIDNENNQELEALDDNDNENNIPCIVRKNDSIRFKRTQESEWENAKVVSRAGKATGKYKNWWNVQNNDTGHIQAEDFGQLVEFEKVVDEPVVEETQAFVMTIPRYLHNDKQCKQAKEKELAMHDKFDTYCEVPDEGQVRIDTNWILTQKVIDGIPVVKARLTMRGDQEKNVNVRKDSPTIRKGNVKIFCTVAAKENWSIKSIDGTSAFLQGAPIEREVFVRPPKERRVPGMLWQLKKPVYGLIDAARGWHLALSKKLIEAGSKKCIVDPAMYLSFSEVDNERRIDGIVLTHVDDLMHGGTKNFENNFMHIVKNSFVFSEEESERFRYIGMNMVQEKNGITVDQNHYIQLLEVPDLQSVANLKMDDTLDADGQTEFRGWVAKILYIGYQSRPDLIFEGKCLSSKFGTASKRDLKTIYKMIQKLKGENTCMFFPDMGDIEEWSLVGYSDAGIRNIPNNLSGVGGQVVLLVNNNKQSACVLNWRSKKLVRKVTSSLAGEALAMVAMIGEIVYNKAILAQIYGEKIKTLPVLLFTDCKNLHDAIHSTRLVEDAWLIPDIAIIQEALEQGTVNNVYRVSAGEMLADCLTKAGASGEKLLQVLQTGNYTFPLDAV